MLSTRYTMESDQQPLGPGVRATVIDESPVCWRCYRRLAEFVTRPWLLRCTRCKATNKSRE